MDNNIGQSIAMANFGCDLPFLPVNNVITKIKSVTTSAVGRTIPKKEFIITSVSFIGWHDTILG